MVDGRGFGFMLSAFRRLRVFAAIAQKGYFVMRSLYTARAIDMSDPHESCFDIAVAFDRARGITELPRSISDKGWLNFIYEVKLDFWKPPPSAHPM